MSGGFQHRVLTAQPQQLNDLLPFVWPPSPPGLGHVAPGRAGCSVRGRDRALQPSLTALPRVARAGCSCSHLGVLPLPSTQRWELASAGAACSPAGTWQLCRPPLPALLPPWDLAFGAAYLCFQCAGLAKPCMFLVCLLFQPCSPPAMVAGSAGSRAHSDHRAGPR